MFYQQSVTAADASYHKNCLAKFKSDPTTTANAGDTSNDAYSKIVDTMFHDKMRIWNAVEIEELYKSNGGKLLSCKLLVQKLSQQFEADLLILSFCRTSNILVFR